MDPLSSPLPRYRGGILDSSSLHVSHSIFQQIPPVTQDHLPCLHCHTLPPAFSHLRMASSLLSYPLLSSLENSSNQSKLLKRREATPLSESSLQTFPSLRWSTLGCLSGTFLTQALNLPPVKSQSQQPLCWTSHTTDFMPQDLCAGCSLFLEQMAAQTTFSLPAVLRVRAFSSKAFPGQWK